MFNSPTVRRLLITMLALLVTAPAGTLAVPGTTKAGNADGDGTTAVAPALPAVPPDQATEGSEADGRMADIRKIDPGIPRLLVTDRSDARADTIDEGLSPGDPLPRIILPPGYQAFVHAEGLSGADGLAFSPDGTLHAAEEYAGQVVAVAEDGTLTPVAGGISHPEGIAFDALGQLYVVEDVEDGRLLRFDAQGVPTVLASGRDAPEGVTVESDGSVLITESNVEFTDNPFQYRTRVTRVPPGGAPETVERSVWFWSYAGIALDSTGLIYVTNEASGTGTTDSVFTIDPASGSRSLFSSGLTACEGLRFKSGGGFPLFVAEEDLGGGGGRLTIVDETGTASTFATGFFNIEDVILDGQGRIFVSEDSTGSIIRITPPAETIGVELSCQPGSGTLPLTTAISVVLRNDYAGLTRTIAARIDLTTGGGHHFGSWRAGYVNVAAGASFVTSWNQQIPALGTLLGDNRFLLNAEDVTPAPYNQPPYPPSGDTGTAVCTVSGLAR